MVGASLSFQSSKKIRASIFPNDYFANFKTDGKLLGCCGDLQKDPATLFLNIPSLYGFFFYTWATNTGFYLLLS